MSGWADKFKQRSQAEELMDQSDISQAEFVDALQGIQWVNRHLKGSQSLIDGIRLLIKDWPSDEFRVLDVGTGSADIPVALWQWGQKNRLKFEITAVDRHPYAVEAAQKATGDYDHIHVVQGDALQLPYPDKSFDIVTSSMFLHHLDTDKAVRLLQEMARLSRVGFVINDLERAPLAYYGIMCLGKLSGLGRLFMHDAPLSVLKGFRVEDIQQIKVLSGLTSLKVLKKRPYRLVLIWWNSQARED
jgi:ubiquinone/menaquinone biosynthesis C-methylase UbiE